MKILEKMPDKYDAGISILTGGKLRYLQGEIAAKYVNRHDRVLEIGCGTGDLAILAAKRGAKVVAIDRAPEMLAVASKKIGDEGLQELVEVLKMDALDMDTNFQEGRFDVVTSTLTFSELTAEEVDFILKESARVLRPNGTLAVADEVVPRKLVATLAYYLYRIPALVITYILARSGTSPLRRLEQRIKKAGFRIVRADGYLFDSLELVVAQKV